jgi:CRP-like cAMP-binding protein
MTQPSQTPDNLLLAALPDEERNRLNPFLKRVELSVGDEVTIPGEKIENLYFPIDAVSSTVHEMSDGSTIETGLMGIEGLVGVQVWLQQSTTAAHTFIQIPGTALKISTADFIREVRDRPSSPLNALLASYVHAFLVLTSLMAACNRLHSLDERLCRWLSMVYNRARRSEFPLRQEFLAQMLGVHRPTVSTAAHMLQEAGLIQYHYGKMQIVNPNGLEEGACECYRLMEAEMEKIFKQPWVKKTEFRADIPGNPPRR